MLLPPKEGQSPPSSERPHAFTLARLSQSLFADHDYSAQPSSSAQTITDAPIEDVSDDSRSPDSDDDFIHSQMQRRCSADNQPVTINGELSNPMSALSFDPDAIRQTRSSDWTLLPSFVDYA
ncbi:hypothetical protein NDU88_005062 [Pleurodeles waltl]|uniref:Uncharacterized protein n=1 Tax=Pleurodeles waltl TaxID=8319 RepID=A0AAV7W6T8_PLEWA|nr:hypothetical protein NDU88_005062 [Pleurodeles waltl]